jgi:hypothetical protein
MVLRDSRYEPVTVYQDGREVFLGTRQPVQMDPADDDTWVTWRQGERPDTFAARVWGSEIGEDAAARMYWVLLDINQIVNPFTIAAGTGFRVPTFDRVAIEVLQ